MRRDYEYIRTSQQAAREKSISREEMDRLTRGNAKCGILVDEATGTVFALRMDGTSRANKAYANLKSGAAAGVTGSVIEYCFAKKTKQGRRQNEALERTRSPFHVCEMLDRGRQKYLGLFVFVKKTRDGKRAMIRGVEPASGS